MLPPIALSPVNAAPMNDEVNELETRIAELRQQEKRLQQDIASLQSSYNAMLQKQVAEAQMALGRVVQESLSELEQRKQKLQISVEQLERRQDRIRNEMKTSFAGASQDLAIRVQGFKDYLVGSLQDLATSAEQLQLVPEQEVRRVGRAGEREESRSDTRLDGRFDPGEGRSLAGSSERSDSRSVGKAAGEAALVPKFAESNLQEQTKRINKLLDQYRMMPDYYGQPWQLRRTFEPIHADRVSNWFFTQGGRGSLKSLGSRLQNILVASAVVSVLRNLYGDRVRVLVLGDSPERLGEWRRGLQDCLGVSRGDFGSEQGIVLFEAPEPLVQRAERLLKQKQLPLIIIDESEGFINLALLQFPLWLAFASDPTNPMVY
jgi:chaperonin cofactor prefoldin